MRLTALLASALALVGSASAQASGNDLRVVIERVQLNGVASKAAGGGPSPHVSFNAVACWKEWNNNSDKEGLLDKVLRAGHFMYKYGRHKYTCAPSDGGKTGTPKKTLGDRITHPYDGSTKFDDARDQLVVFDHTFPATEQPTIDFHLHGAARDGAYTSRAFLQILAHDVDQLTSDDLIGIAKTSNFKSVVGKTVTQKLFLFKNPSAVGEEGGNYHYGGSNTVQAGMITFRVEELAGGSAPSIGGVEEPTTEEDVPPTPSTPPTTTSG